MDKIRGRKFCSLAYGDPRDFLIKLRSIEGRLGEVSAPEKFRRLRSNRLKQLREMRDAALLCVGIGERFGLQIQFAPGEDEDFDFVATWATNDAQCFCPVQLKEVAPEDLNPNSSIADALSSLAKYSNAQGLTVAIRLNRTGRFEPALLTLPGNLTLGGLWVLGCVSEDQSKWAVWGDFVGSNGQPTGTIFGYPT